MKNVIKLKVMEAQEECVGKNIVTLNMAIKQKYNIVSGDVIEINGSKKTTAQVWPENTVSQENIIRMDQYIRHNAGVSIGDFVEIQKIDPPEASQIVLSPVKEVNLFYNNYDLVVKKSFLGRSFLLGDNVMINLFGSGYLFVVTSTTPKGPVILSESTNLTIQSKPKQKMQNKQIIGYEDVGGLKKQIESIREMVELPIKYSDFFKKLNLTPPKGVLLYGPPGTGKTLLARAISTELNAKFISIDGPQIMAKFVGEAEEKIRKIFDDAEKSSPTIIFIDEIDAIASKRDNVVSEVEKRVVAQLLACMDGMSERGEVIVIGATNRPQEIDSALRRPGRFDREIEIGVPDENGRLDILKIHTRNVPLSKDVSMTSIAQRTHGYIGADLAALVKEAGIFHIKNAIAKMTDPEKQTEKVIENLKITNKDFNHALKVVQPSALREVFVDVPNISLSEVGALASQKEIFEDIIKLSLKKKDVISKMNLRVPKNLLLYGPPGTGKTMFVKACAKNFEINFIYIKGPEILNKWLGQSEKTIRDVFKKARDVSPCILFFDEIDSLALERQGQENQPKVLDQLLTELDNISDKDIIFIAATNRPELIDKSFMRSGRIDKIIEFAVPTIEERKEILSILLKNVPSEKINLDDIINVTNGFSGADLNLLIREATLLAIKENNYQETKIKQKHILEVLKKLKPTVSNDQIQYYNSFKKDSDIANYIT
jgi:transitional endoplasmic reticulum ATPase